MLAAGSSGAVDPSRHVLQFRHTAWRVHDGIFAGAPSAITQTADGYMWIATDNGVVRFDGARFTVWSPPGGGLPSSDIIDVLGARDGSLWIAMPAGLSQWRNGVLANYIHDASDFEPVFESRDGSIWQ
jgi:ligand-binding sensor domain-containing protein